MNSWRLSSVMWPVAVRNWMPSIHSASVRWLSFTNVVQVAHERRQDLLQARVGAVLEAADDRLGDVVLGDVAHRDETPVVRGAQERPRAW